jgi:D-alanyl-D-alanine carboxypeptidase
MNIILAEIIVGGLLVGAWYIYLDRQPRPNLEATEVKSSSVSLPSTSTPIQRDYNLLDSWDSQQVLQNFKQIAFSKANSDSPEEASYSSLAPGQEFRQFSGQEFVDFYNNVDYSYVNELTQKPEIYGDRAADARIQLIAEQRGYKLRSEANQNNLVPVSGEKLQPKAKQAWQNLKQAAAEEGETLLLVSGFRSVDNQQRIFTGRLGSKYSMQQIAEGNVDERIDEVLQTSSIPGYSKHHTGYTLDLACDSASNFTNFEDSTCFDWISKNNYRNAKKYGFIPSYPEGAQNMGPNPEAWEYVWVGREDLIKD